MDVQHCLRGIMFLLLVVGGNSQADAADGAYSDWSPFSECNASCGGGVKIRKRSCNSPEPKNGGKDCSGLGPAMGTEECNSFPCPVHGGYSQWSNFTKCSATCGGGFQSRTRTCTNPLPCCGGNNCDDLGPNLQTQKCSTCPCVIDGNWSEWCPWGSCNATCGGGVRYRHRTCTNPPPQGGGQNCLGSASESQECNTQSCGGGECTEWSGWSDCSVTCGVGAQKRTKTCPNPPPGQEGNTGEKLLGPDSETKECSLTPCPTDGNYTEWTGWSNCSAICGGGSQTRSRNCTNPAPQDGGKNCDELGSADQTQECNPDPCRPPCSIGFDIGIVVDTSQSVKVFNLRKVMTFLADLVDHFNPSPDEDHFGLVTFNRKAFTQFTFADRTLYSVDALKKRIGEIPLDLSLQTRTDLAMIAARDNLFSPSGGDRPDNPNIMIMLTDGKPTRQPEDFGVFAAEFHKDHKVAGWYTIAVGIGTRVNQDTLREIAGKNGDVIIVKNFDLLVTQLMEIKNKICDAHAQYGQS